MRYCGTWKRPGAHFPFNFLMLTDVNAQTNAHSLNSTIYRYLDDLTPEQYPNWVSGNHDWPRIPSRMGYSSCVDIINTLTLLLPGTSTVFMGDETGMDSNYALRKDQCPPGVRDDYRTPTRCPFQWSTERNAGFTKSRKPWIPVNPEYYRINVASETRVYGTHLNNFKNLVAIKKRLDFADLDVETYVLDENLFAFTRQVKNQLYLVLINLSDSSSRPIALPKVIPKLNTHNLTGVPVRSVNMAEECANWKTCIEKIANPDSGMAPKSVIVLQYTLPRQEGSPQGRKSRWWEDGRT